MLDHFRPKHFESIPIAFNSQDQAKKSAFKHRFLPRSASGLLGPGNLRPIRNPRLNQVETTSPRSPASSHIPSFVKDNLSSKCTAMASTEKRPDLIALARELNGVPMCDDYEKMISGMLCVFPSLPIYAQIYIYFYICTPTLSR